MSRYSPTVLPRAFDFGGILDRLAQGYSVGRGIRRDRREEREHDEDRRRNEAARRSQQLSMPGASTLADYLDTELGGGRQPLTEGSLQRIGRASEEDVDFEFRQPDPTTVQLPSGQSLEMQERAPFMTDTGVVMDPSRARQEQTLATYIDSQMLREPTRTPWQREGFSSEREYLEHITGKSRAEAAGRRPYAERSGLRRTPTEARSYLYTVYGKLDDTGNISLPREATPDWIGKALAAIEEGREPPPLPMAPMPVASPIRVPTPGQSGDARGSGVGRVFQAIGDFFRGRGSGAGQGASPAESETAAPAAPTTPRPPTPPADGLPQPRSLEELELSPEQQAKYEQLLGEGWAPDDIVDELAADEWDVLVQGGMAPDAATRQVAQKYGRSGAQ